MTGCWIRLVGSHRFVTQFSNPYYASNDDQPLSISPMIVVPPDRISSRPSELVTGRTWLDVFAYQMTGCWIRLVGSHRFVTQFFNIFYASNDD